VILRQLLVLSPRLTFQLYAQLFTDYGRYGPYWIASRAPGDLRTIRPGELRSATLAEVGGVNQDFHDTELVVNAVLRWEYRLGSTLYLVYARNQTEVPYYADPDAPPLDRGPPASLLPRSVGRGPTSDTLLVKWSWWFGP
jgi:hypothetical protein